MDNYKLKLKIGPNEFEAEGPADVVKEQFREFKELIIEAANLSAAVASLHPSITPGVSASVSPSAPPSPSPSTGWGEPVMPFAGQTIDQMLDKIMRVEDRTVSLTVTARSIDEAVLLLMYGQKAMRANDSVTGAEVMGGLAMSGVRVERADRLLVKAGELGDLIVVGIGRAKRYRLTNAGIAKARQIATDLLATVA